jgi:3-deoxy-D-manno-octulosonate 8-phosphate phosphatase (KDO 8-P phosphatase)
MDRLQKIKLLAMDVDGVLTDGSMIYMEGSDHAKVFNVQDGLGIRLAILAGLKIAWITGNVSPAITRRAQDLGVTDLYQSARHKPEALRELTAKYGLARDEIAYIGDDLNDLPAFAASGVTFAPSNAASDVKEAADVITQQPGGSGAVREVIEMILQNQGTWKTAVTAILQEFEQEQSAEKLEKTAG